MGRVGVGVAAAHHEHVLNECGQDGNKHIKDSKERLFIMT